MFCAFAGRPRGAWKSFVATTVPMISSLMLLLLTEPADAAALGSLVCNPSTVMILGRSRTALCSFSLEGDDASSDLFHMDAFAFDGLDGDTSVVFLRTKSTLDTLEDGSQEPIWMGSNSDDTSYGFTTLVQGSLDDGVLAGNINTEQATYLLAPSLIRGAIQVTETLWENAKGFSTTDMRELDGTPIEAVDLDLSDAIEVAIPKVKDREMLSGSGSGIDSEFNRDRKLQETTVVKVLLYITNRAMCESAGLEFGCPYSQDNSKAILSLLSGGRTEINDAFEALSVPVEIVIAKVIFSSNETSADVTPNDEVLAYLKENTKIEEKRVENEANLVAILTGDDALAEAGGRADSNGYTSATAWTSFSQYGFMHQLMHNFGALHNPEDSDEQHPYAHGFYVLNATVPFRTVMAYPCPDVNCPPVPFLSSSKNSYRGARLGDETHDNARLVAENAPAVANFPPDPCFFNVLGLCLCFSDHMTVMTLSKGSTRMDQLEVGDWVLTKDGSYSKVYGFGHRNPQLKAKFLQIYATDDMQSDAPLELTADHMLYIYNESTNKVSLLPASQVKSGDLLMAAGASSGASTHQVKFVHQVTRMGVYAPFTVSGDIVVNGVASSNYIALPASFQQLVSFDMQHSLQHAAYTPYRLFCGMSLLVGGGSCKVNHEETGGFSEGVWMWLPFLQWLEKHHSQGMFLPIFLYTVAVPVQWIVLVLEQGLLDLSMPHVVAALVGYLVWKNQLKKKKMPLSMAQTKADGASMKAY